MAVEHRQAARDVKAAHGDRHAGVAERPGDVEGARILVRLDADQRHQAEIAVVARSVASSAGMFDARVGLVDRLDVDADVRSEHLALGAVGRDAVERGQRVRRDHRPPPADHIPVVVIMRRLDEEELERATSGTVKSGQSLALLRGALGEYRRPRISTTCFKPMLERKKRDTAAFAWNSIGFARRSALSGHMTRQSRSPLMRRLICL